MEHQNPWKPTEADIRRRMKRRRRLSEKLGVDLPQWEDESRAPAVNEGAIRGMLDRTHDDAEQDRIMGLVLRFRSWAEVYCQLGSSGSQPKTQDYRESSPE